jgi:hypothetical protein
MEKAIKREERINEDTRQYDERKERPQDDDGRERDYREEDSKEDLLLSHDSGANDAGRFPSLMTIMKK